MCQCREAQRLQHLSDFTHSSVAIERLLSMTEIISVLLKHESSDQNVGQ